MKTIRQLYTYLTTLVSLEVVIWGVIRLTRTFANPRLALDARELAGALALIVVGVPIFWIHWQMAQRQAGQDEDEQFSLIRALFLYSALLAAFIPLVQNSLALVNRLLLHAFQQPASQAIFGGDQIWSDNAIAVFMNAVIGSYIYVNTRKDWSQPLPNDHLRNIRRAYRYIFLLYGLGMMVGGIHEIIRYLFSFANTVGDTPLQWLSNGLALLVIGTPLWLYSWQIIQDSFQTRSERLAMLRQVVLFLLNLISVVGTLISLGFILHIILTTLLGESQSWSALLAELGQPVGFAVPLGGIWAYYGRAFRQTFSLEEISKRGNFFRTLTNYLLAGLGTAAVIIGLQTLLNVLIDLGLRSAILGEAALRNRLSASLSSLAIGLPLWLHSWSRINVELTQTEASADQTQRSLIRKTYLYLMLFAGIIGGMISGGQTAFILFKALLGLSIPDLIPEVLSQFSLFLVFSGLFSYHLVIHRRDTHQSQRFLSDLHAHFPVLILDQVGEDFASRLSSAIQRETPSIPVTIHNPGKELPPVSQGEAKAVILPSSMLVEPTPEQRAFLETYSGQRLVVPTEAEDWHWVPGSSRQPSSLAKSTSHLIRYLAEGENYPDPSGHSPLQKILTFLGILFSLQLLFAISAFLISLVFN